MPLPSTHTPLLRAEVQPNRSRAIVHRYPDCLGISGGRSKHDRQPNRDLKADRPHLFAPEYIL
jgi:hypothetical protein